MYTLYYFFVVALTKNRDVTTEPSVSGSHHSEGSGTAEEEHQKEHNRMLLIKTGTECPSRCVVFPGASSEGPSSPGTHIIFTAPAGISTGIAGLPLHNWMQSSWVLNY